MVRNSRAASSGAGEFAGGKPGELKTRALEALRRVATLLVTKAPEDAAAFKAWLTSIAKRVAKAAKEGGFLDFSGVQVSDAEKAAPSLA